MHDLTRRGIPLMLVVAMAAGCDEPAPKWASHGGAATTATPTATVAPATVNGAAISAAELALAMGTAARAENPHGGGSGVAPDRAQVLAGLIDQELAAQRAVALGLDADPGFKEEQAKLEAQLASVRRQRLASLFDKDVAARAAVTPAAVQAFYDQHVDEIRTRVHVWQILFRDRAKATAAAAELAGGATFEAVAQRVLNAPPGTTPWDVGYLAWNQLPPAWSTTLPGLAVGGTSGVIAGPGGRFWIIRVIDRQRDDEQTFERARPAIELRLGDEAAQVARAQALTALRKAARIELAPAP
ncbi:MAG: peptidyl-prolyl cis-trans isomerase [Myxococcales bacterium]|nr:peptidyl-prolyl cis-trans isomerase [Myxococcales bacterium]